MYKCGGRCSITYMSRTDKRWRVVASVTNRHHWSDPLQIGYTEKPSASREQKFFLVDIKWVPKTLANNCERLNFSQVFRSSWIHPFEKRSYVPSSFCAIAFFFIAKRASSSLPTVAASPCFSIHLWSISLAFSREHLKSASTLRTTAAERFSLIPRSSQHDPTSSHMSSTSSSLTTAALAPSAINVTYIRIKIRFWAFKRWFGRWQLEGAKKSVTKCIWKFLVQLGSPLYKL